MALSPFLRLGYANLVKFIMGLKPEISAQKTVLDTSAQAGYNESTGGHVASHMATDSLPDSILLFDARALVALTFANHYFGSYS